MLKFDIFLYLNKEFIVTSVNGYLQVKKNTIFVCQNEIYVIYFYNLFTLNYSYSD